MCILESGWHNLKEQAKYKDSYKLDKYSYTQTIEATLVSGQLPWEMSGDQGHDQCPTQGQKEIVLDPVWR